MKNVLRFCFFVTLFMGTMLCVTSCEKDKEEAMLSLTPSASAIVFSADGESATANGSAITPAFTVSTNQSSWSVSSNKSWLRVVAKTATGFSLTADANPTTTAVEAATVTVSAGSATPVTITVTQLAADANLSVSPLGAVEFSADGTKAKQNGAEFTPTFTVTTNVSSWDATADQSWLHVAKSGNTFTLSADAHTLLTAPPAAKVTVTAEGTTPVVIDVTQTSAAAQLSLTPATTIVPLANTGGETSFTVTTNAATWNAVSNQTWVTIEKTGMTLILKAGANPRMSAAPQATVTVSAGAADDIILTVTQPGNPAGAPQYAIGTTQFEVANQIWSDYINYDRDNKAAAGTLTNLTTFVNKTTPQYCKSNPITNNNITGGQKIFDQYFYNWHFVDAYKDELCPSPWRVPSKDDFVNLDIALGGTGTLQNNVKPQVEKYENLQFAFNGRITTSATDFSTWYYESYAYCWTSTQSNDDNHAYQLFTHIWPGWTNGAYNVSPDNNSSTTYKAFGMPVRCVKNKQ